MGKKRKNSFLQRLFAKLNPSAPFEPEDPGEDVSDVEPEQPEPSEEQAESEQAESQHENGLEPAAAQTAEATPKRPRSAEMEIAQELRTAFELYSKVNLKSQFICVFS